MLKAGWHCGGDPAARGTVADCPVCNYCQGATAASATCIPDPSQMRNACASPNNPCFSGSTCGEDPNIPGRPTGVCEGGTPLNSPNARCASGGLQLGVCVNGTCQGSGPQCPASCANCVNGQCVTNTCLGQSNNVPCNSGGTSFGTCQNGQCIGDGSSCPSSCNGGSCLNGVCTVPDCTGQPGGTLCIGGGRVPGICVNGHCEGQGDQCSPSCNGGPCIDGMCRPGEVHLTWLNKRDPDHVYVRQGTRPYGDAGVLSAAASSEGGTYTWTTSGGSSVKLLGDGSQVRLEGLTEGTTNITVRYVSPAGLTTEASVPVTVIYPVMLVHGINSNADTWSNIRTYLSTEFSLFEDPMFCRSGREDVAFCAVDFGSESTLAAEGSNSSFYLEGAVLRDRIQAFRTATGASKIVLIAHSQGGLAARTGIQAYGQGAVVQRLVTIGTPHLGSEAADLPLGIVDLLQNAPGVGSFFQALPPFGSSGVRALSPSSAELNSLNVSLLSNLLSAPTEHVSIISVNGSVAASLVGAWDGYAAACRVVPAPLCDFILSNEAKYHNFFSTSDVLVSAPSQDIANVPGVPPSRRTPDTAGAIHVTVPPFIGEASLVDVFLPYIGLRP